MWSWGGCVFVYFILYYKMTRCVSGVSESELDLYWVKREIHLRGFGGILWGVGFGRVDRKVKNP